MAVLLAIAIAVVGSGCASIFDGTRDLVTFTSKPTGAKVISGDTQGETPCNLQVKKTTKAATFSQPGFPDKTIDFKKGFLFGYVLLDILFTPYAVTGIVIDAAAGAFPSLPPQMHCEFEK